MAIFAKALAEGFTAAKRADLARKEINSVFRDLNDEVRKATANKISIERVRIGIGEVPENDETLTEGSISAIDRTGRQLKDKSLALFRMDDTGYPFTISWNKKTNICEDKEALIICLASLLRDPEAGRKMAVLKAS